MSCQSADGVGAPFAERPLLSSGCGSLARTAPLAESDPHDSPATSSCNGVILVRPGSVGAGRKVPRQCSRKNSSWSKGAEAAEARLAARASRWTSARRDPSCAGSPKTEIAKLLGVSRQTLYDIPRESSWWRRWWHCDSGSCAETVRICGSIWRSAPISNGLRRSLGKIKAIPTLEVGW